MNKIALFCAVAAMALGASAGDGFKFKFSSSGDTYADGSGVQSGEVYALVWTTNDVAFAGFKEDGTLVDAVGNDVMAYALARDGGCPTTIFIADETHGNTGFYQMYLLDTRAYSDAGVAGAPTGLGESGKPEAVKGFTAVVSAKFTAAGSNLAAGVRTTVDGSNGAALPADVPVPVITDVKFLPSGAVQLTVENVVPYVQYTVSGGATPSALDQKDIATGFTRESGSVKLTVANPGENRFFKVVNK